MLGAPERPRAVVSALHECDASMREIMIVASDIAPAISDRSFVVTTPLDAIMQLERRGRVRTIVLAGTYARDPELAAFLGVFDPSVHVERED